MRRILIRGGVNPLKPITTNQIILHNRIGGNSGNTLYLTGVLRSLYSSDTDIDVDEYKAELGRYNDADIERLNSSYDAYVVPLADAFRKDFINSLDNLTNVISKLKIPVYVLSVGLRANYDPDLKGVFPYEDATRKFVKTVLSHSPMIGLRGEITAQFLQKLGFIPEKDFTVIGCPSLYIFGDNIKTRDIDFNVFSTVSVSFNPNIPKIDDNILNVTRKQKEWYVVAQNIDEIKCIHLGICKKNMDEKYYFTNIDNELYVDNHMKGFLTAGDWIRYMHKVDFAIGGKFHGNVAAILGGVPTCFIPSDARMQELIQFHNLPHIAAKNWVKIDSFEEVIKQIDFTSYKKTHLQNFSHYKNFLDKIGLPSVWSMGEKPNNELLLFSRPVSNAIFRDNVSQIKIWNDYMQRFCRKAGINRCGH